MRINTLILLNIFTLLGAFSACGIKTGVATPPNDPLPVGTVVKQGPFTGQNGKIVTGVAKIYQLTSDGTYVIRIEGIQTPGDTGQRITGNAGGTEVYNATLRLPNGTQNYSTGLSGAMVWNSVSVANPSNITAPVYGTALLQ